MKSKALMLTTIVLLGMSGCIFRSLNPLFFPSEDIYHPDLKGYWETADGKTTWYFERVHDKDSALILHQISEAPARNAYSSADEENSYKTVDFKIILGKIGEEHYFDFYPYRIDDRDIFYSDGYYIDYFSILTHIFAKVKILEDRIIVQQFNYYVFLNYVREKKTNASFTEYQTAVKKGKPYYDLVLTDKTNELQKFILEYSKLPDAFGDEDTLYKAKGKH